MIPGHLLLNKMWKLIKNHKWQILGLSLVLMLGLFYNIHQAHAFVMDVAAVQLDALDFIDNTVLRWISFIFLITGESVALLGISSHLLDWASALPVGLDNPLVQEGWQFISGLTNITFILILIFIAFSYILKLDNSGVKKALPRLIIIAILINFSKLFVGMAVDIGWVVQNSFKYTFFQNGDLSTAAVQPLISSAGSILGVLGTLLGGYLVLAVIPYANVWALVALGTAFFAVAGTQVVNGSLSQAIIVVVLNFVMGGVFFIYSALFLVRTVVIWLLTIVSPLAFAASILPQTKKFFDQWVKMLVQWIFLGVVMFFLMGLGIKLFNIVIKIPSGGTILGDGNLFNIFYKYFFLLVYLLVTLAAVKKFVPAGGEAIWSFGKSLITKNLPGVTTWAAKRSREFAQERMPEGVRKFAEGLSMVPPRGGRVGSFLSRNVTRGLVGEFGSGANRAIKQKLSQTEKSIENENVPGLLSRYHSAPDELTKTAILNTLIKKGKIDDAMNANDLQTKYGLDYTQANRTALKISDLDQRYKQAKARGIEDTIKSGLPYLGNVVSEAKPTFNTSKGRSETLGEAMARQVFSKIKTEDWANISKGALKNPICMEAILRTANANQISKILDTNPREAIEAIRDTITSLGGKKWLDTPGNTNLNKYFATGAGALNYGLNF